MPEKKMAPQEKGNILVKKLQTLTVNDLLPYQITHDYSCLTGEAKEERWKYFVPFPKEVKNLFPGSYISPELFLQNMDNALNTSEHVAAVLGGRTTKWTDDPVFEAQVRNVREGITSIFKLSVANGMTNPNALEISRLSQQYGPEFSDTIGRVEYQCALAEGAQTAIQKLKEPPQHGVIIHDDCMASGDTIAGYILRRIHENPNDPKIRKGIKVIIDGPATAQSILLLKQISDAFQIDIDISANWIAFGLSEGVKKDDGTHEHANYITYPDELITRLPEETAEYLRSLRVEADPNVYVCGDMGNAGEGYEQGELDSLLTQCADDTALRKKIEQIKNIHINRTGSVKELRTKQPERPDSPDYIVFPRGGYQSYNFMVTYFPRYLSYVNTIVEQASRRDDPNLGYGVVFDRDEEALEKKE